MNVKCLVVIFLVITLGARAQQASDIAVYIENYKALAISEMQRTGVPASIILAQGIHETEAGTSDLVKKSNNHFGIKCKDTWSGARVYHDDDARGECFRSYTTAEASYRDHSDFLRSSPRYQFLFKLDPEDYSAWAYGLKKAGYATNVKYSQILIRLIETYNLQQYTLIAMGKIKPQQEAPIVSAHPDLLPVPDTSSIVQVLPTPASIYPDGEFMINNTRVIFARAGTSLLKVCEQYGIALSRLLEFNEMEEEDVLAKDQLLFLQRKRKTGSNAVHVVQAGESIYDIAQEEGVRFENVLEFNHLSNGEEPAGGEKIYLQSMAPSKPQLAAKVLAVSSASSAVNGDPAQVSSSSIVTHVVQPKETLYSISKKYGVAIDKIQTWNKLDSGGLKVGQALIIYKN